MAILNLGFRISNDYGVTWEKVSDVTTPSPIDFHTMAVGSNPNIMYGASGMGDKVYFSLDEGTNWNAVNPPNGVRVVTLAVNQLIQTIFMRLLPMAYFQAPIKVKTGKK